MSQEATIIAVDDSDFMRNGDFHPSRMQAQTDAVSLICQSKRQRNPENTLGLLTMANTEVLCMLTTDTTKLYNRLFTVEPKGSINFCTAIQIAHLALRLRQLRHQKMRIICFIGSPISDDEKTLVKLAKRLKKEKVNVDAINFGENEGNQQKLSGFIDTINGKEGTGSHLVSVPSGTVLHDSLVTSPIIAGEFGGSAHAGLGLGFGLDASEDPDLLYALRVSMEDQRMRQEHEVNSSTNGVANETSLPIGSGTSEEAMLQQALRMSMQQPATGGAAQTGSTLPMDIDLAAMTEEEQIAYALEMSLQQTTDASAATDAEKISDPPHPPTTAMDVDQAVSESKEAESGNADLDVIRDASFLQEVLRTLPGVNPLDQDVISAIDALSNPESDDKKDDTKKNDKSNSGGSGAAGTQP